MAARDVVLRFISAINAHDVAGIGALASDDHEFVDGLGQIIAGRDAVEAAWRAYFEMCPDYSVFPEQLLSEGELVAIFGHAAGAIQVGGQDFAENSWRIPAAWLAHVADGRVTRWCVYADNKPVYDILARAGGN